MTHVFYKTTLLLILSSLLGCTASNAIKPFTTDGCSFFPEGTRKHQSLWANCCLRHDFLYWQGGTFQDRLKADRDLKECVEAVGEPEIAVIMLAAVRAGGTAYLPTSFRWGYGWSYPSGYNQLTTQQRIEIKKKLDFLVVMIKQLSLELKNQSPVDDKM